MSSRMPTTDAGLLAWSNNFRTRIASDPAIYGLTAQAATAYEAVQSTYATAYQTAVDPGTRTRPSIAAKDAAKAALQLASRQLGRIVEGTASVTDAQKLALGLNVRRPPTPRPAPTTSPILEVMAVTGRTVRLRLHGDEPSRRGKPKDVVNATIFTYIGETPSSDRNQWRFEFSSNKLVVDIEFADDTPAGTRVWMTACWNNAKCESGPMSQPIGTLLGYGLSFAA
ncbi:MAG: hypothetical protein R3C49_06905 [Planctomycetaceae bacterium]